MLREFFPDYINEEQAKNYSFVLKTLAHAMLSESRSRKPKGDTIFMKHSEYGVMVSSLACYNDYRKYVPLEEYVFGVSLMPYGKTNFGCNLDLTLVYLSKKPVGFLYNIVPHKSKAEDVYTYREFTNESDYSEVEFHRTFVPKLSIDLVDREIRYYPRSTRNFSFGAPPWTYLDGNSINGTA